MKSSRNKDIIKRKGAIMTAGIKNNFIDLMELINIAQEALKNAPYKLFENIILFIIKKLHEQEIELERMSLELDEMQTIPVDDLDEFYDNVLKDIDDLKLLKRKLEQIKNKDPLFLNLYNQVDKLITNLNIYMDRMGQLEIRILKNKKIA